jgi:transposase
MTAVTLPSTVIGVGIDTSRYGHHVTFLRDDLQPATKPIEILESREGYGKLLQVLHNLQQRFPSVCFHIRVDVAGQYATNLQSFLNTLPFEKTISIGDPIRNKNYRVVHYPKAKSDPVESASVARFAVLEQPKPADEVPAEMRALRDVASRLEAQTREVTRHVNQLHNVLARVFPELSTIVSDLQSKSVLTLLKKYPTPARIARARLATIEAIPYLRSKTARRIHEAAKTTVGSLTAAAAETIVCTLVDQVRYARKLKCQYEELLVETYKALHTVNHLETIPGIGVVTAAVLTAKIVSIDRFERAEQLVGYFGIFPEEKWSGIGSDGSAKVRRSSRMSRKGNDLVRHYLYTAAWSATQYNPAVRALYRRLRARGVSGNAALGHAMRKLLHLAFAVWKSDRPFDPDHYPWEQATDKNEAAGHKQDQDPDVKVVTATPHVTLTEQESSVNDSPQGIDFQAVRAQVSIQQVFDLLDFVAATTSGDQVRGCCPIHGSTSPRSRSFSANLAKNVYRCFKCQSQGNQLDLWAAATNQTVYDAATDLCHKLHLEIPRTDVPRSTPEQRRGTRTSCRHNDRQSTHRDQGENRVITADAY